MPGNSILIRMDKYIMKGSFCGNYHKQSSFGVQ